MKELWVSMGDNRVCPDCEKLAGEVKDSREWDIEGRPGERETLCGERCRCVLVEALTGEEQEMVDELTEKVIDKIRLAIDETSGHKIALKDFADISGMLDLPYKTIAKFEDLIRAYNEANGALPKEFYRIGNIKKQIVWLEDNT